MIVGKDVRWWWEERGEQIGGVDWARTHTHTHKEMSEKDGYTGLETGLHDLRVGDGLMLGE